MHLFPVTGLLRRSTSELASVARLFRVFTFPTSCCRFSSCSWSLPRSSWPLSRSSWSLPRCSWSLPRSSRSSSFGNVRDHCLLHYFDLPRAQTQRRVHPRHLMSNWWVIRWLIWWASNFVVPLQQKWFTDVRYLSWNFN